MTLQYFDNLGPIIGHRGAAAIAPENTLEGFAVAHEYGLKAIEFDVALSADGEAFIFHDVDLKRTTNGKGQIGLVSSEYLKTLDAGSWFSKKHTGIRIPTFEETLAWLLKHRMTANIEIKPFPGYVRETVEVILTLLEKHWPATLPLPLVSSFEKEALILARQRHPQLPLGYLFHEWRPEEIALAKELQCVTIHFHHRITQFARVQMLKEQGFLVYVYTINNQYLINKLFKWGVDAVFSDYPEWKIPK